MNTRLVRSLGLSGLLIVSVLGSAVAQDAAQSSGPHCLFPLFCPGPVPPVPPPLIGAPDDPAEAPPPPVEHVAKHKRVAHKKLSHKPVT